MGLWNPGGGGGCPTTAQSTIRHPLTMHSWFPCMLHASQIWQHQLTISYHINDSGPSSKGRCPGSFPSLRLP
jgi:hypothetical protein